MAQGAPDLSKQDLERIERLADSASRIRGELSRRIVGMDDVIDKLLIALFSGGHCLLVGVPGLAKTLLISSLGEILSLKFSRIQFTPDLMPSDITGTELIATDLKTGERKFQFSPGPLFANLVLADEINRTPPKTQAALMEAMEERHVTSGGKRYPLEPPFYVLATQNPIEQEGTYPLPVAQLDRFMFEVRVEYPSWDEEYAIATTTTSDTDVNMSQLITREDIIELAGLVRRVAVPDRVITYAADLVRLTRIQGDETPQFVRNWLQWGIGPRGGLYLLLAAKASAMLNGRATASEDDVRRVAKPVLRHRLITTYQAEAEGMSPDGIVDALIEALGTRVAKQRV